MKKKRRFGRRVFCVLIVLFMGVIWQSDLLSQEPAEVRSLRKQEILQTDDNYREYYFGLLTEDEKKIYREMLSGIQERQDEFYLTSSNEQLISKVYHALLKDHPELFWVHNREEVYTTAYKGTDYCRFSPGYTYTDQEIQEIMAFLPKGTVAFQLYLRHAMPSLVTELKSEGYTGNSATHLQKARNYNRDKAYPLLGFDKFYDYTNMGVPFVKMRNNATDQCTYDNITHDYEQQRKSTDAPYFGYTMTIQNHSSYDVPFDNFDDKRIVVENADAPDLGYYLSLIKYSDEMFENLINYYKNTNEPTVILLTGDHQPRIHDESMDSITNGEWRNWNDEEMMRRYEVPFLIWANYDIDKKIVEKTSMNYLQTILMETIDGDLTGFQKFQQDIQKEIPVLTSNGYWGADGKFYSVDDKNSPYYDLIQEYAMLQYNDMMDYKNRVEDFFELKQ